MLCRNSTVRHIVSLILVLAVDYVQLAKLTQRFDPVKVLYRVRPFCLNCQRSFALLSANPSGLSSPCGPCLTSTFLLYHHLLFGVKMLFEPFEACYCVAFD